MKTMDYPLSNKLDEKVKEFIDASLESSYRVERIEITDERISVSFGEEVTEESFRKQMEELLYISKSINKDLLFESKVRHPYNENPMKYLEAGRDAVRIANGIYMFQGTFLRLFRFFNEYFRNLAEKYNAIELDYPPIWPVDLFREINYFNEFPQQVILTTTVKDSFEAKNRFSQRYDRKNSYDTVSVDDNMQDCRYGLEPAVCDTCYYALKNETNYENRIYTIYNKVFRNEYSKSESLDRLMSFSVRDIMFVGDRDFVLMTRQRLIEDIIDFLEYINLDSKVETANDPFFTSSAIKNVFQYTSRLKYELLAKLNYSESYLAVGSINFHLDFFGRAFNIRLLDGTHAYSGCIGIGFERLVYALYCQYGHDASAWPLELKNKLNI